MNDSHHRLKEQKQQQQEQSPTLEQQQQKDREKVYVRDMAPFQRSVTRHQTFTVDHVDIDFEDPKIKNDMVMMILQYLQDEGYNMSAMTLQDESHVKMRLEVDKVKQIQQVCDAILVGDWGEVDRLCNKDSLRQYDSLHCEIYRQQFLEMIESGEHQKAFTFLYKRIKPYKSMMAEKEFMDMCYLLTCKSVQEVDSFKHWDGVNGTSREKLVEKLQTTLVHFNINNMGQNGPGEPFITASPSGQLTSNRLKALLKQAAAYQVLQSRYQHVDTLKETQKKQMESVAHQATDSDASTPSSSLSNLRPSVSVKGNVNMESGGQMHSRRISTLLSDYESFVVPNRLKSTLIGHSGNVKCVEFIDKHNVIASGSSDCTVRLWSTDDASLMSHLQGHNGRIWDISASRSGSLLATASADTTVKIWDIDSKDDGNRDNDNDEDDGQNTLSDNNIIRTLAGSTGDIYSCRFHPGGNHVATGGYDMSVRLFDVRNGETIRRFQGHTASVSSVVFNPYGNLVISGSKDNTIKFWDIVSGVCIRTLAQHLGEVTSVETNNTGTLLLSSSKDNSNRLWDMRTSRPIRRFKGHQNTYSNHIRASFGPDQSLVLSGSEDGRAFVWDLATGRVLQKLGGHKSTVYQSKWSGKQGLMASCSNDETVKLWLYDPQVLAL